MADVTYNYTGNLFNQTSALLMWEGGLPDEWEISSAELAAALRDERITISFSSPVYIPATIIKSMRGICACGPACG